MAFTYVLRQQGEQRWFAGGTADAGCFTGLGSAVQYDSAEEAARAAREDVPVPVVPECVSLARIGDAIWWGSRRFAWVPENANLGGRA